MKHQGPSKFSGKTWTVLCFRTWEELVLFQFTFVSLKIEGGLTEQVDCDEFIITGEVRIFQATIIDDVYQHSLQIFEDMTTHVLRLNASVWEGPHRYAPVWTAFINTKQAQSKGWIHRKGRRRVLLHDIQPYVFCADYHPERMRQNIYNAFEIEFDTEEGLRYFREIFPVPAPTAAVSNPNESTGSTRDAKPAKAFK
ncbi:hypothetical protein SEPCBS57363_004205 [Sporothrix epigloea]|uniref:Uncharacterized protein n=1 Tax=Sporothrix epigloea TaxID=1892477 RepID=A0ABP0DSW2_9PEZI